MALRTFRPLTPTLRFKSLPMFQPVTKKQSKPVKSLTELRTWNVAHAIPKKWLISDLNANENSVVIETMELSYRYFSLQDGQ